MAYSGSHARHLSVMGESRHTSNSSSDYSRESPLYSTAYNGSQGHIDDRSVLSLDFAKDGSDDVLQRPEPSRSATPARPALGSRLLSSLSSAQPAAVGLARKGSLLHARAKSLAGWAPKLNTANTLPPEKPQQQRNVIFGDLFNGESAPVRIGIPPSSPTKEESEFVMEYKPTFTERPSGPRRRSTAQTVPSNNSTPAKTGWFGRKSIAPTQVAASPSKAQDELLTVDINSALFPNGPSDELSPHAYNELLLNATTLLQRMQTAYKEKVDYIASIRPEIDAQKEEVEEAETRSRHLKIQLEDMSFKADEQNKAMQEMAMQLAEEKMKVHEAHEAARTVRMVRRSTDRSRDGDDEESTPRRGKRRSAGSASDSGFESDADYAESVVSGGAETPLTPPTMTLTPAYDGQEWSINPSKSRVERPALSRQSTRSGSSQTAFTGKRLGSEGAAWATVEHLRGENNVMKRQMEEMQKTLQGCIDFVGGVRA